MSDTRSKILSTAEKMVRSGGYNGFSFREIALSVGIKSASVHHHFPTKESLTLEVARLYEGHFFEALGEPAPAGSDAPTQLNRYCEVFKAAFESSGRACLCGVLSNEAEQLPESVREVIIAFVQSNVSWLEAALMAGGLDDQGNHVRERAEFIYSALEGAMGVAALRQDVGWIDRVAKVVCQTALN